MAEREFNNAGDRKVFENLNLKEQDRRRIEAISKRQRSELLRLRRQQKERWSQDMASARQKIVTQHNRPSLRPAWYKGGPLPKGKVEQLAYRTVKSNNQQELDLLNAQFEKEKNDIISQSFLQDRDAITKSREQRKRDRKVTRYRSRSCDKGDRGR